MTLWHIHKSGLRVLSLLCSLPHYVAEKGLMLTESQKVGNKLKTKHTQSIENMFGPTFWTIDPFFNLSVCWEQFKKKAESPSYLTAQWVSHLIRGLSLVGPWLRVVSQNSKVGHETMKLVTPQNAFLCIRWCVNQTTKNHVDVEWRSADSDHRAITIAQQPGRPAVIGQKCQYEVVTSSGISLSVLFTIRTFLINRLTLH